MGTDYRPGQFVWRELMTTDVDASLRFYGELLGWKVETMTMPDGTDYHLAKMGDAPVGGIMKHPMPESSPSFWCGSVSVEDVDAVAARVTAAGGTCIVPPMDAAGMGRYAGFLDAQGAVVNGWRSNQGDGPAVERRGPGEFCWEQLNTAAPDQALAFYGDVFGWTHKPFGSGAGDMKVFESGGAQVASVLPAPPGVPTHWLSYVVVDALAAARDRATQQGGKVLVERMEIPGVGAIAVIQDNVGAMLGLFEMPPA